MVIIEVSIVYALLNTNGEKNEACTAVYKQMRSPLDMRRQKNTNDVATHLEDNGGRHARVNIYVEEAQSDNCQGEEEKINEEK